MANIRENKKNGKVISFRFTVCLERDVRGKQIRKYTTWTAPADLTPAKARKAAERAADPPDALQNGGTELPHSFPRKDHGGARRIRRRRKAQRRGHRVRLRRASCKRWRSTASACLPPRRCAIYPTRSRHCPSSTRPPATSRRLSPARRKRSSATRARCRSFA